MDTEGSESPDLGKAADCKSVYTGSIPVLASINQGHRIDRIKTL